MSLTGLTDVVEEVAPPTPVDRMRAAILHGDAVESIPPPEPLVEGFLNRNSLAVLFGRPGSAKTFLALDIALHVATGAWWHGHAVEAGHTLYVVAEGTSGVGLRQQAWRLHHGQHSSPSRMHWLPRPVNLLDPVEVASCAAVAAEIGPDLVVFDTLARCMAGGDENSGKDMSRVIASLDQIRAKTRACVLVVHHTGKDQSNGARGHSSLLGAIDTELEVKNGGDGIITLSNTKQKDSVEQLPLRFRLQPAGDSVAIAPYTSPWADPGHISPKARLALDALVSIAVDGGVTTTQWLEVAVQNGVSRSGFYQHRKQLLDGGQVQNVGTDKQPRYAPTTSENT